MRNVTDQTKAWVETMVIGLGLCPFTEKVFKNDTIRYSVSDALTSEDVLKILESELDLLLSSAPDKIETTLLILPKVFADFLDFNDFTHEAEALVGTLGMRGTVQVVGFHPQYQFDGTSVDAPENYTNRSPFPMIHLLREQSITDLGATEGELLEIPKRNIEVLKRLGLKSILEMLHKPRAVTYLGEPNLP